MTTAHRNRTSSVVLGFGVLLAYMALGCGPRPPGDDDSFPADDDSTSSDDDTTAADDDTTPPDDDATAPDDDTAVEDDDTGGPDDDATSSDDDATAEDDDSTPPDDDTTPTDSDGDGVPAPEDCDDADPARYPGAGEVPCDGVDQDCDGSDVTEVRYADADSDGYGDVASALECGPSPHYVSSGSDCDDLDPERHPGAEDVLCDGVDQDCDGADATEVRYADADGDGFGDAGASVECSADPTYVLDATDCDDANSLRHPGASDPCNGIDEDCDGSDFCSLEGTLDIRLADGIIFTSDEGDASCDYEARGGGDINGDGIGDVVVGQACSEGEAWVLYGPVGGYVDLEGADAVLHGEYWYELSGVVASAGDLNADGYDDLVIGGPYYPTDSPDWPYHDGVAYVVYGPVSGEGSLADADGIVYGEAWSMLGKSVSGAGDLDGDGYDDLLIGVPFHGGDYKGAALVFHGPVDGVRSAVDADAVLEGVAANYQAGYAVAGGRDIDADGVPDILVGTYSYGAHLVTAMPSGLSSLATAAAHFECESPCGSGSFGPRLALLGDMDGDGGAEVLMGDPQLDSSGGAHLFRGSATGTLPRSSADSNFFAEAFGDGAGISVAGLGDVDGEGYDDVLVGAAGNDFGGPYAGAAYLVYGPIPAGDIPLASADARFIGLSPTYAVGGNVASAGDVNADGLMDLIITAIAEVGGLEQSVNYLFYGRPR